ncbi:uncharacterized protein TNCV_1335561 [Trichonephila clavipes]|nr:uncharacterized protein TNCV_1335561 [Trichonephila clavipes]
MVNPPPQFWASFSCWPPSLLAIHSEQKRPLAVVRDRSYFRSRGVGTSGSERCHLHENQVQDAVDRQSSRRPPHRKKCTRTANCFIARHPGTGLETPRTIRRRLAEEHLGSRRPIRVLPLTPTHRGNWTAAEWNQVVFSDANPDSISAVMTIVFVCGDPVVNALILPLLYSCTPLPQLV